jgi:hypothetical protein
LEFSLGHYHDRKADTQKETVDCTRSRRPSRARSTRRQARRSRRWRHIARGPDDEHPVLTVPRHARSWSKQKRIAQFFRMLGTSGGERRNAWDALVREMAESGRQLD